MRSGLTIWVGPNVDVVDLIRSKRDGSDLRDDAIDWVIAAYTRGEVAEEQMSALLMAIFFVGLTAPELNRWTAAMIASGERLSFPGLGRPTTDKHSTGGVGDKITLPLTPIVAACGAAVPHAATIGVSGSVILSPTPPVECLSVVGLPSPGKLSRSPEAIIAAVHLLSSGAVRPTKKMAMSSADICSSATSPRV